MSGRARLQCRLLGEAVGVGLGCWAGMAPLLLYPERFSKADAQDAPAVAPGTLAPRSPPHPQLACALVSGRGLVNKASGPAAACGLLWPVACLPVSLTVSLCRASIMAIAAGDHMIIARMLRVRARMLRVRA